MKGLVEPREISCAVSNSVSSFRGSGRAFSRARPHEWLRAIKRGPIPFSTSTAYEHYSLNYAFTGRQGEMCRYQDQIHTYSLCKLLEEDEDGSPNILAELLRRISSARAQDGKPGSGPHVVKVKQIIQCSHALDLESQQVKEPNQRQCPDPIPVTSEDGTVVEKIGETEHRGICPVCQAAEQAIDLASNATVVVGIRTPMVETV